jgi:chromosome segregation ATPase
MFDDLEDLISDALKGKKQKKFYKRSKEVKPLLKLLVSLLTFLIGVLTQGKLGDKRTDHAAPVPRPQPEPRPVAADGTLQSYLDQAQAYRSEIQRLGQGAGGAQQSRLQELAGQVDGWVTAIQALVQRVADLRQNRVLQQDFKTVPQAVDRLNEKLARETDPVLRTQLEQTLNHRRQQQSTLEQLQQVIRATEVKIESTLSLLGTVYSQLLTGQSKNQVADYRHLLSEIDEEVYRLQDHLEAIDEVRFRSP